MVLAEKNIQKTLHHLDDSVKECIQIRRKKSVLEQKALTSVDGGRCIVADLSLYDEFLCGLSKATLEEVVVDVDVEPWSTDKREESRDGLEKTYILSPSHDMGGNCGGLDDEDDEDEEVEEGGWPLVGGGGGLVGEG